MNMRMEELFYQRPNVPDIDKNTVFVALQKCTLNILWGILTQHEIKYDFFRFSHSLSCYRDSSKFTYPFFQM